jgi:hypothetical protein
MAIEDRVLKSWQAMADGRPEDALHDICSAIEATANAEYGDGGGERYKQFIHDNLYLITKLTLGSAILNLHFEYDHPDLKPDADGRVTIQQIMYHVVRCGLYHTASLPSSLVFTDKQAFQCEQGKKLAMPASLIFGMIVAVVASPANKGRTINEDNIVANIYDVCHLPLNSLWGKREALLKLIDSLSELRP